MTKIGLINKQNSSNNAKLPRIGIIRLGRRDAGGKATEVDHFLFDIQEQTIKDRIIEVYGPEPKSLDITFHSDDLNTVYTCEYQNWGTDNKGKPYLKCSGNGATAVEFEKKEARACSCRLMGNKCRQKTIIRFLIPTVTLGGTFLLVTKSQRSIIETTLKMAQRSGSLTKRKFKLLRTEGFATVNKFKVKKCFLALVLDEAAGVATERSSCQSSEKKREENLPKEIETTTMTPISSIIAGGDLVLWDDAALVARQEEIRKEEGREKVLRKLKLIIKDHGAEAALKAYACERFVRGSYEELAVQELLILWHDIDERRREVIKDIYNRILMKDDGLKLEPYKDLRQNIG